MRNLRLSSAVGLGWLVGATHREYGVPLWYVGAVLLAFALYAFGSVYPRRGEDAS